MDSSVGPAWKKATNTFKSFNSLLHRRKRNTPSGTMPAPLLSLEINTALTQERPTPQIDAKSSSVGSRSNTDPCSAEWSASTISSFILSPTEYGTLCDAERMAAPRNHNLSACVLKGRPVSFTPEAESYSSTARVEPSLSAPALSTHLGYTQATLFGGTIEFSQDSITVHSNSGSISPAGEALINSQPEEDDLDVHAIMSNFNRIRLNRTSGSTSYYHFTKAWLEDSDAASEISFEAVSFDDNTQAFPLPVWPKLPPSCGET
ncbi:hypothetical protein O181_010183 [Austropuccinia psidii MF-1]|uniref:Uncharacterized protein n=1 Tax=Austropuccinia psidii MF-1 TaxID=1389203 RepID=A0A9Q3GK45_9BASI|nr:hypothetical protein [Austropuccinia psidii MF-1]